MESGVRIQKVLAQAGLGSRRACDALVEAGRVLVNGEVAGLGTRIDPAADRVLVDGALVRLQAERVVYIFNKPAGVVSTMSDDQGRLCIGDYVRDVPIRLFHVGRLDEETEGLLLLTNDGDLSNRLMHPSHGVFKTYVATVRGEVTRATLHSLERGIDLDDGPARADRVEIRGVSSRSTILELVIHEGRKRIVRRMLKAVGHPVEHLMRTRIGELSLGDLPSGRKRLLTQDEVAQLISSTH